MLRTLEESAIQRVQRKIKRRANNVRVEAGCENPEQRTQCEVSCVLHRAPFSSRAGCYFLHAQTHAHTHTHAQGSITNNSGVVTRASVYAYNTRTHTHGKLITAAKNDAKTIHAQTSKTVKTRK